MLRIGVSARALGGGVQGRPDAASAVATGSEKKKTNRTLAENGEKSKFTRRSGRPFVIAQCVRIGRVAPTPPTEYCPNIKTSRAHAPRGTAPTVYSGANGARPPRPLSCACTATYVCIFIFFFFPRRVCAHLRRRAVDTIIHHYNRATINYAVCYPFCCGVASFFFFFVALSRPRPADAIFQPVWAGTQSGRKSFANLSGLILRFWNRTVPYVRDVGTHRMRVCACPRFRGSRWGRLESWYKLPTALLPLRSYSSILN